MKKDVKCGFSLIELLAVIVVLAIIALITTPVILNVIEDAKRSSFMQTANGIISAAEYYRTNNELDKEIKEDIVLKLPEDIDKLKFEGEIPKKGEVKIYKDGAIILAINNENYCVRKFKDESELQISKNVNSCILPVTLKDIATTSEELGITSVNNCILSGVCEPGTPFAIKVNDSEIKKFYVLEENDQEIKLIMNSNTSEKIAWYADKMNNSSGPLTILNVLKNDTDGWTNIPERKYIIEDDSGYNKYNPIQMNMRSRLLSITEAKKIGCIKNGTNLCPSFLAGHYWLSSASGSYSHAHRINGRTLQDYIVNYTFYDGVRPIITLALNERKKSLVKDITIETNEVVTIPNVSVPIKSIVTPIEANNKVLKWSSSDESIATVDATGLITGVLPGQATIYVESTDGSNIKNQVNVIVSDTKKLSEIATTSEQLEILEVNECSENGICESGTPFAIKVNDTEIYKFYVVKDDGKDIILIMNQNVGINTMWKELESIEGPVSVFNILKEQTDNWTNISLRPYTLSDELHNTYVNVNFYNMRARILSQKEANEVGCVKNESCNDFLTENTNSYWLSTSDGGVNSALAIGQSGIIWLYSTYKNQKAGVRPVITVPKG